MRHVRATDDKCADAIGAHIAEGHGAERHVVYSVATVHKRKRAGPLLHWPSDGAAAFLLCCDLISLSPPAEQTQSAARHNPM
jgi:hypothetical protein